MKHAQPSAGLLKRYVIWLLILLFSSLVISQFTYSIIGPILLANLVENNPDIDGQELFPYFMYMYVFVNIILVIGVNILLLIFLPKQFTTLRTSVKERGILLFLPFVILFIITFL